MDTQEYDKRRDERYLQDAPRMIVARAVRRVRADLADMLNSIAPFEIGAEEKMQRIAQRIVNELEDLTRLVR